MTFAKELPSGWESVKLKDLVQTIRGVTFSRSETKENKSDGYIGCLTTSAVQKDLDLSTRRFISKNKIKNQEQILKYGYILISNANSKDLVGKSCIVGNLDSNYTFGAFVTCLRPNYKKVIPKYLSNFLMSDRARNYIFRNSSATTNISNIRVSDLVKLNIPLPALEVQESIVGILVDLLCKQY